ncbi:hypothetical protein [Saccharothrix xinjiangensis]|uniref:Alpha/beta hydrolase family protein n=1 Tax=Saccharothrix xinjiangensis TaxID=204798 RepID=A0ABV9Y0T1_9PSEU
MRVLAVVAPVAGLLVAAPEAGAATIPWQPCPDRPEADCGTVSVPLDWANPRGPRVDRAVSRVRAADPARRIGVVFVDAGGPGGSGAEFARAPCLSAEVRARFDVVGFDQLGTNNSSAIRCSSELMARHPGDDPADEAAFAAPARHDLAVREDCRARHPVFDHVNTTRSARDLDAVRAALARGPPRTPTCSVSRPRATGPADRAAPAGREGLSGALTRRVPDGYVDPKVKMVSPKVAACRGSAHRHRDGLGRHRHEQGVGDERPGPGRPHLRGALGAHLGVHAPADRTRQPAAPALRP